MQFEHLTGLRLQPVATTLLNIRASEYRMDARFPFLDQRLLDFVMASPLRLGWKPGSENTKWLLREAMNGLLPDKIRLRTTKADGSRYFKNAICLEGSQRSRSLFTNTLLARYQLANEEILLNEFDAFCDGTGRYTSCNDFFPPMFMEQWLRAHAAGLNRIHFDELRTWQVE
jgi:hypothetical protein